MREVMNGLGKGVTPPIVDRSKLPLELAECLHRLVLKKKNNYNFFAGASFKKSKNKYTISETYSKKCYKCFDHQLNSAIARVLIISCRLALLLKMRSLRSFHTLQHIATHNDAHFFPFSLSHLLITCNHNSFGDNICAGTDSAICEILWLRFGKIMAMILTSKS